MTTYEFDGMIYDTMWEAEEAVTDSRPELLDDDLPDFFLDNIEIID